MQVPFAVVSPGSAPAAAAVLPGPEGQDGAAFAALVADAGVVAIPTDALTVPEGGAPASVTVPAFWPPLPAPPVVAGLPFRPAADPVPGVALADLPTPRQTPEGVLTEAVVPSATAPDPIPQHTQPTMIADEVMGHPAAPSLPALPADPATVEHGAAPVASQPLPLAAPTADAPAPAPTTALTQDPALPLAEAPARPVPAAAAPPMDRDEVPVLAVKASDRPAPLQTLSRPADRQGLPDPSRGRRPEAAAPTQPEGALGPIPRAPSAPMPQLVSAVPVSAPPSPQLPPRNDAPLVAVPSAPPTVVPSAPVPSAPVPTVAAPTSPPEVGFDPVVPDNARIEARLPPPASVYELRPPVPLAAVVPTLDPLPPAPPPETLSLPLAAPPEGEGSPFAIGSEQPAAGAGRVLPPPVTAPPAIPLRPPLPAWLELAELDQRAEPEIPFLAPTATGPTAAAPGLPAMGPAAPPQLAAQVLQGLARHQDGTTEITLSPEELGTVRLRLRPDSRDAERMVVLLSFDRPETLDLFRRHADQLAEAIRSAGYSGVDIGFDRGTGPEGGFAGEADHAAEDTHELPPLPAPLPPPAPRLLAGATLDLRL